MSFRVEWLRSAAKELSRLPAQDKRRVQAVVGLLPDHPKPPNSTKLSGRPEWRVRVGRLRILYLIDPSNAVILITSVEQRGNVYKRR